jgi:SAM-dependent methyltransferase
MLDVGCGKGQFVAVARERGIEAWGVELDQGACEYAREELGVQTVLHGSLDHPGLPSKFDVITLWDVIEHVPDPVSLLRETADRLNPGGLVVVRTANIRSFAFDRRRAGWWAFGSDHRFYFSPGSLSVALRIAGLSTRAVLNRETVERVDKHRAGDISETSMSDGLRAVANSPGKVLKLARYARNKWRRTVGLRRYGTHYDMSIMTVLAVK